MSYQLGLVRVAEDVATGRRIVQLTALGRYVLGLGAPPVVRDIVEHFLIVQPSFEVIAYRQGLNPAIIGKLSLFTRITQVGAALALALTPESAYRGFEGGLTVGSMLGTLGKHSARPLSPGVAESLRSWADRRERVIYRASATLIEFVTPEDLEAALADWPAAAEAPAPRRITERLLLVEDDHSIPFHRFRITGSRSYRNPPESCIEVGNDGVTLTLDPTRTDLLVDAELNRFAEELAPVSVPIAGPGGESGLAQPRRRFVISRESLARGMAAGLTPGLLSHWFARRTNGTMPPALRLIMAAGPDQALAFTASRRLILRTHVPELLDGLLQHPATRDFIGERIGPDAAFISDTLLPPLREAVLALGLSLDIESV